MHYGYSFLFVWLENGTVIVVARLGVLLDPGSQVKVHHVGVILHVVYMLFFFPLMPEHLAISHQ